MERPKKRRFVSIRKTSRPSSSAASYTFQLTDVSYRNDSIMGREICKFKTGSLLDVQADSARAEIHADSPSNDSVAL